MVIGFIGAGNMAEALIKGIISAKVCPAEDIVINDKQSQRQSQLQDIYNVRTAGDLISLVSEANVLILSVKPQNMDEVLNDIAGSVMADIVISIAAGVTIGKISGILGNDIATIRVMPNTPALISHGASALYSSSASSEQMDMALSIFSAVGSAVVVDSEDLIDAVTAVSGSGPAYYFQMMEHMIQAAKGLGLDSETASKLVVQTAKGAALLAEARDKQGETPAVLRQKVTSPGGTTAAALEVFKDRDFGSTVNQALKAAYDRSKELSG